MLEILKKFGIQVVGFVGGFLTVWLIAAALCVGVLVFWLLSGLVSSYLHFSWRPGVGAYSSTLENIDQEEIVLNLYAAFTNLGIGWSTLTPTLSDKLHVEDICIFDGTMTEREFMERIFRVTRAITLGKNVLQQKRFQLGLPTLAANADCGSVDVWMPENNNMLNIPAPNDTNDKATLVIKPPTTPRGAEPDCMEWHWHQLKPGEKPPTPEWRHRPLRRLL